MPPLWRVTRNPYARRLYDGLKAAGVTATRMYEYETTLPGAETLARSAAPDGVTLHVLPADDARERGFDVDVGIEADLVPGEWAVLATTDRTVGRALVRAGDDPHVHPLDRRVSVPGAYVRRVYVDPAHRGRGLATVCLRAALSVAAEELEADRATALVAADNVPSRRLFEGRGFEVVAVHEYVRLGPAGRYRRRSP